MQGESEGVCCRCGWVGECTACRWRGVDKALQSWKTAGKICELHVEMHTAEVLPCSVYHCRPPRWLACWYRPLAGLRWNGASVHLPFMACNEEKRVESKEWRESVSLLLMMV